MFKDSLVESRGRIKTKKGWATLLSLGFQLILVAAMVLVPLIYTEALPRHPLSSLFLTLAPPRPLGARVATATVSAPRTTRHGKDIQLRPPVMIPREMARTASEAPPAIGSASSMEERGSGAGDPAGSPEGVFQSVMTDRIPPPLPPAPIQNAIGRPGQLKKIVLSQGVLEGYVIQQMKPGYPNIAKIAGVSGPVVLQATISAAGVIENIRTVSGPPLLMGAAVAAVKTWRYRPYLLNGTPVEVETQITVNFSLGRE